TRFSALAPVAWIYRYRPNRDVSPGVHWIAILIRTPHSFFSSSFGSHIAQRPPAAESWISATLGPAWAGPITGIRSRKTILVFRSSSFRRVLSQATFVTRAQLSFVALNPERR